MKHQRGRVFLFPLVLMVGAFGLLGYGFSRDGFWLGALAVFLLWWADRDRKQSADREREQKLIAENAPELVGKDFVEAGAYTLAAIDKFKESASPLVQQVFADALLKQQGEWSRGGKPMPVWATFSLLRRIESASPDGGAELQQILDSLEHKGDGQR